MSIDLLDKKIKEPDLVGSYSRKDVVFLLKDIGGLIKEKGTQDREEIIQGGGHYSEMLPIEYKPSDEYLKLFHSSMKLSAEKIAAATGIVSEEIIEKKGKDVVFVSLARAGTPFGILMKRYINHKYGIDIPHFSISIIRGKGIDENALIYIIRKHGTNIQFIDGWTGKGMITLVLDKACNEFEKKYGIKLDNELAVLADPGNCSSIYGTREDFLLPSACLNSTVSGLVSRTVHRADMIGEDDFHGVKFYDELAGEDLSNIYIDSISEKFDIMMDVIEKAGKEIKNREKSWIGLKDVEKIKTDFMIEDMNLIKPGIGETTRVLLRRIPWKILINSNDTSNLEHILVLAKEKGVEVVKYPMNSYQCCGIIKPKNKENGEGQ